MKIKRKKTLSKALLLLSIFHLCLSANALEGEKSLPLPMLIKEALNQNPQIRSLEAALRASDYEVEAARWQFIATPSISSERVNSDVSDSYYKDGARVTYIRLQQPLFTWGRINAGLSIAQAKRIISISALEEARQHVALNVTQAYVDWMSATLRKAVYQQSMLEHLRLEELITRRIDAGLSPQSDYLLVKSRIEQLSGELLALNTQQENSMIKLSQLLGRIVSDLNSESCCIVKSFVMDSVDQWVVRVESNSPYLRRLLASSEAASFESQRLRATLLPEVYARAEYQRGHPSDIARINANEKRIFFGFSTNLGAGLSGYSALKAADAKYESALEEADVGRRNIHQQIMTDYSFLSMLNKRIVVLNEAQELTTKTLSSGERQFLAGRKSWQELMNTSRDLTQAKLQVEDDRVNIFLYSWRLIISSNSLPEALDAELTIGAGQ